MTDDATKDARREVAQSFARRWVPRGVQAQCVLTDLFEECADKARAEEREACAEIAKMGGAEQILRLAWGGVSAQESHIAKDVSILVAARIRRRT